MSVKAKFTVNSVTKRKGWGGSEWIWDIQLNPVTSGSEENKSFYASTPSGEITLGTVNAEVASRLEPGKTFYVTFDEATS